jgi:hypothetical protein
MFLTDIAIFDPFLTGRDPLFINPAIGHPAIAPAFG